MSSILRILRMKTIFMLSIIRLVISSHHHNDNTDELTTIYSSCNKIEQNGLYYIKPTSDLPILPVICNNGYTMIDGSLDININILPSFLTSYDIALSKWDIYSRLDDVSTFREWFIPADINTKFRISPNCDECIDGDFGDNTVYYIDSNSFCFSNLRVNGCIDDKTSYNYHSESCHQCDDGVFDDNDKWIECHSLQMHADHPINHDHLQCVAHGLTFHPVIPIRRQSCNCYKPKETDDQIISYQVPISELPIISWTVTDPNDLSNVYRTYNIDYIADNIKFTIYSDTNQDFRETNVVHLYNTDFLTATYRILESGTYVIMEDITFNFNTPNDEEMTLKSFSPNSIDEDELYWYPTHEQAAMDGTHPGLYRYEGAYSLGFFAGISIEADYVTIDLNGHSLSQHPTFYFQQRFFALIEMASQPFIPGQGPSNWGASDLMYPSNILIKDGILGLTSHHSIHGINNNFVTISNINAGNFDVAGMQCNACTNIIISDCMIGPQNKNIPVLGRYTHARAFIPRLKQLMEEHGNEQITFYNRDPIAVSHLVERLINQMDMIYFHFNNGIKYDDDNDKEWIAAKKLFVNPSGWMDGGSSYGIVIGGTGAQVVGIGARYEGTASITLNNVEIYGIGNKLIEKIKFSDDDGALRLMFFDAIDWISVSDQVDNPSTSTYIGDAYTDCIFAVEQLIDSWYYLNSLHINSDEEAYVFKGDNDAFSKRIFAVNNWSGTAGGCGTDIQLHSSKGAIGLRVDGVQNIIINGLHIHDISNWADLGNEEWCGPYNGPMLGREDIDIQYGYTGTRSHGMVIDYAQGTLSNIKIENIESYHGEANGLTVYKGCDITLENIEVDNINAGTQLSDDQIEILNLPNLIPRACGVDIRDDTLVNINNHIGIINGDHIIGFQTCFDDKVEEKNVFPIIIGDNKKMKSWFSMSDRSIILIIVIGISIGFALYLKRFMDKDSIDDDYKNIDETDEIEKDYSEYLPLL